MSRALKARNMNPFVVFASNLRDAKLVEHVQELMTDSGKRHVHSIINTTGFTIKPMDGSNFIFERLKVPVLQAIFSTANKTVWEEGLFGLPPTDIAMNIMRLTNLLAYLWPNWQSAGQHYSIKATVRNELL
jgi:cobaltochelatase CobN